MIRIFIVDDHPVIRAAVRGFLEVDPDLTVTGEAATARSALEALRHDVADVVLIDVSLPDMSGIELARTLRSWHPLLRLAMLSGHANSTYIEQALEAGARGYIVKGHSEDLTRGVRVVAGGGVYMSAGEADLPTSARKADR